LDTIFKALTRKSCGRCGCRLGPLLSQCLSSRPITVSLSVVSAHYCVTVCRLGPLLSHSQSSRPITVSLSVVSTHYCVTVCRLDPLLSHSMSSPPITVSLSVVSAHYCLTVCRLGPLLSHCLSSRPITVSLSGRQPAMVLMYGHFICEGPLTSGSWKLSCTLRKPIRRATSWRRTVTRTPR
jgi:hypothetical protein